jgi:hypothetical protein
MRIVASKVQSLCNAAEAALIVDSTPKKIGDFSEKQLAARINRSRILRDKYRDRANQQSGEAKGTRQPRSTRPAQSNENTVLKAEFFGQALSSFEARLGKLQARQVREAARAEKAAAKAKKPVAAEMAKPAARKPAKPAKAARKSAPAKPAAAARSKRKGLQAANTGRVQGHVKARTARAQAKKDSKR